MLLNQPFGRSGTQVVDDQIQLSVAQGGQHQIVFRDAELQGYFWRVLQHGGEYSREQVLGYDLASAYSQVPDATLAQIRDFARDILQRQSKLAHAQQQRRAFSGQLDASRRSLHQFRLQSLFQPPQALADRRLAQSEGFGGTSQMAVLGDYGEIFNVAQLHLDNPDSCSGESEMIE